MKQYHYAPISGAIAIYIDNKLQPNTEGWAGHHRIMAEFLKLREEKKIDKIKTVKYGHEMFSGHSGQVDIYEFIQ